MTHQFSRQLAESEYARTEVQRELHSYKVQLRARTVIDENEATASELHLLEHQLKLVREERTIVTKQRDAFAVELERLLHQYERQCQLREDHESALESSQSRVHLLSAQIAHLQAQVSSMASERDNVELRMLKTQFEDLTTRWERSEREKEEMRQRLVTMNDTVMKESADRQKRIQTTINEQVTPIVQTANQVVVNSIQATNETRKQLQTNLDKSSKKRKEREEKLALTSTADAATESDEEQEPAAKKDKKASKESTSQLISTVSSTSSTAVLPKATTTPTPPVAEPSKKDGKKKEEKVEEKKPIEKKSEKESKKESKSSSSSFSSSALEPISRDDTSKASNKAKKDKKKTRSGADSSYDLEARIAAELDEEVDSIASKWKVNMPKSMTTTTTMTTTKDVKKSSAAATATFQSLRTSKDLDLLNFSPLTSSTSDRLSQQLAAHEAELDAAARDESLNSSAASLNDSLTSIGSIDSVTGERRRKLFSSKTHETKPKSTSNPLDSPPPPRFQEKPLFANHSNTRQPLQPRQHQPTAGPSASAALTSQSSFSKMSFPSKSISFNQPPPPPSRPLASNASVTAANTRNLFMHFLGGAMKVPKIKQHS